MGDLVETDLEFIRAEGCDEGFSGEVLLSFNSFHKPTYFCVLSR